MTRPAYPLHYPEGLSDSELYDQLYRDCGTTLCNPWAFKHDEVRDVYADKKHRGDWYRGDEVRMLKYLSKQGVKK